MTDKTAVQLALIKLLSKPTVMTVVTVVVMAPMILLGMILWNYCAAGVEALEAIKHNTTEMSVAIKEMCRPRLADAR